MFCSALFMSSCVGDVVEEYQFVIKKGTGISFSNDLASSPDLNLFNYLYFYNGAGIGAGDFNNDGYIDLYFTSNLGKNKMYLNQSGFKFKEIEIDSDPQNLENKWSNGVSIIDVNNDGLLDIYVSQVSNIGSLNCKNLLYVCTEITESGIPIYEEKASKFGLANIGYATQSVFLDFDLDGDLDMFQLNHALHANGTFGPRNTFTDKRHPLSGDKFFENRNSFYVDISEDVGIESSAIGYGLGVMASDINMDGYPDIYVCNDFHENDYMYINQRDGTFKNLASDFLMHSSRFSMGLECADLNNDSYPDILSLDMLPEDPTTLKKTEGEDALDLYKMKLKLGYDHQFAKNSLQINNRNGTFSEIAMYSNIHASDWSWAPLVFDFDNDGNKDIFISNGIPKRMNDIDYINFVSEPTFQKEIEPDKISNKVLEFIEKLPEEKVLNKFYYNNGDLSFEDIGNKIGKQKSTYSNGAVYADLDNDGDLDVVVNNINENAIIYENKLIPKDNFVSVALKNCPDNINCIGSKIFVYAKEKLFMQEKFPVRGFQSSMEMPLLIGVDDVNTVDSVVVVWPDNSAQSFFQQTNISCEYQSGLKKFDFEQLKFNGETKSKSIIKDVSNEFESISFVHQENDFVEFDRDPLIPHMNSTQGPAVTVLDLDKDGLEDLFLGNARHGISLFYKQTMSGKFESVLSNLFKEDINYEDVDGSLVDINNDGLEDLIIVSAGNEYALNSKWNKPRVYKNLGNFEFEKCLDCLKGEIKHTATKVLVDDINADGYEDVILFGRTISKKYGIVPPTYILINNKNGQLVDLSNQYGSELHSAGMVKDAELTDINKDGRNDLVIAFEWGGIEVFTNEDGKFKRNKIIKENGWWNFVLPFDFDNDGDIDILAGNLGLNSRLKANVNTPVKMYYADFDNNGKKDQVLTYNVGGKEIPFANKHELERQIPKIKKKYLYAKDFADASLADLFGEDNLKSADLFYADYFKNAVLINEGDMKFTLQALPANLQWATYNDAVTIDYNGDEFMDIFMGGNFYDNNIQMGRMDSDFGTILINKGSCNFEKAFTPELIVKGQVRKLDKLKLDNRDLIVAGLNNDSLKIFEVRSKSE